MAPWAFNCLGESKSDETIPRHEKIAIEQRSQNVLARRSFD
jgi:hypothetical protein